MFRRAVRLPGMRTMLTVLMVAVLTGCVVEVDAGADEATGIVEQADSTVTPVTNCSWSGGYYWCKDVYSGKWCTNAYTAHGWDLTYCNWSGWNSAGNYCGNPTYYPNYEWAQSHTCLLYTSPSP